MRLYICALLAIKKLLINLAVINIKDSWLSWDFYIEAGFIE